MEPQVILKNRSENKLPDLVKNLNNSLTTLQPNKSETTQLITYALLATAVVGIMVYHYIKDSEIKDSAKQRSEDLEEELKKRNG